MVVNDNDCLWLSVVSSINNRKLLNQVLPGVVAWLRRLESAHARPGASSLDAAVPVDLDPHR